MQVKFNPWSLWFLGSLLFFAEYVVRTSTSVMVGPIMHDFAIDAFGLGVLASYFYYPYILMQIPVGLIVDRFPAAKVLTVMAAVFAIAVLVFASASHLVSAEIARALMGLSAAFAFVGTLKMVTEYFSGQVLGFLTGATQAVGMLGAACGEGPTAYLVSIYGWRHSMMYFGFAIAIIALALMYQSLKLPVAKYKKKVAIVGSLLQAIVGNKQVLLNAIFAGLLYAPTLAFAELWGVEYLQVVQKISHADAAAMVSWVFIGWGLGAPIMGLVSDTIGRRKPVLYFSVLTSLLLLSLILLLPVTGNVLSVLMFFYGFANSGLVVAYALSGELNPAEQTGLTIAFTNMASVLLGALLQPIIGKLLMFFARGGGSSIHQYGLYAFKHAMVFLPLLLICASCLCLFIKDTNCTKA